MAYTVLTWVGMADDKLPEIDAEMLAAVTGGASSGTSDQVATMLQTLMSSIRELAQSRNSSSGGDSFAQMLPFLMMMRQRQAPVAQPAPAPPPEADGWVKVS